MGSGRGWLAGDWPSTGAFSTLLRRPGPRASSDGVLATKSERKNVSEYVLVLALCLILIDVINVSVNRRFICRIAIREVFNALRLCAS